MNITIIDEFNKLSKQIKFQIDHSKNKQEKLVNSYRLQAIDKVIKILTLFPTEITNIEQVKNIKNIGKSSIDRISEILKTGKLSEINNDIINDKYQNAIDELLTIHGVGQTKAFELYSKFGIKNIKELKLLYDNGKIDLPHNVVTALKYIDLSKGNIPRHEMEEIDTFIRKIALNIDPELICILCGSYRRNMDNGKSSNDIDVLLVHPRADDTNYIFIMIQKLKLNNFIIESLTEDNVKTKYMGFCQLNKNYFIRRIDIRFIPYESYPYALLYFTGSGDFNKKMRIVAISMGYKLNEYGMYKNDIMLPPVQHEIDIFRMLNMEYLNPSLRI